MPTSIHLPKPLLDAVDRRARRLKVSRNRFIVKALENELTRESEWSPGFLDSLRATTSAEAAIVDEMMSEIQRRRTSKGPPTL